MARLHPARSRNTAWPVWLKLERRGAKFTGSYSSDGVSWTKVADVNLPTAAAKLDAGMFAYRSSARFADWQAITSR
jgi:hypothetical protein